MAVEEILQAASALCLSPRKHRPSNLIASMPRNLKRSRRGSTCADTSLGDLSSPSKLPKFNDDRAGLAHDPIVISDSDDDGSVHTTLQVEREEEEQQQEEEQEDEEDESSAAVLRQSLTKRFVYESPTKACAARKAAPMPRSIIAELPVPPTSSTKLSPLSPIDTSSSSKLAAESKSSAAKKSKVSKTKAKAKARTTIQLSKTREAAEQGGITPLDLERVPSGGFKLILRCSFCAGQFTKSASTSVKQEHLSLCAPLQGIKRNATAVETIVSDIQSALNREAAEGRKASDERTVLQDVMHNADIVQHEGRASQIATSPKKRGKDKVVIKKAIKRSTKPSLWVAQDPLAGPSLAPRRAAHNLLPAREAMQAARDTAVQLLGDAISLKTECSSKSEQALDDVLKPQAHNPTSDVFAAADMPSTPKKTPKEIGPQADHAGTGDAEDLIDTTNHLPVVSAEQVFASIVTSSSSPQKSPVKALQKSRERQISREQEQSLAAEGTMPSPRSPGFPQTQPFAPSKLAQRRQPRDGTVRQKLFGAETTTRSLLDLVQDRKHDNSRETSCESKRKADQDDEAPQGAGTKKARLGSVDPYVDVGMLSPDHNAMHEDSATASDAGMSHDQDMDFDDPPDSTSQSDTISRSSMGELRAGASVKTNFGSANGVAGTEQYDEQDSLHLAQTATKRCRDQSQNALIDADSLDEDHDEDGSDVDDDEDTQSFLDLLEPSEVIHEPLFSPTHSMSDPSSDDIGEPDATEDLGDGLQNQKGAHRLRWHYHHHRVST